LASADGAPNQVPRLGILGGTFDPVHLGHLILAEETRVALRLDSVIFIPAAQPWRKAGRAISSAVDRLAMVELAISANPFFAVSQIEILRAGPTFTADTLDELHEAQPDADLWFILGSDALLDLPNWKDPGRILARARLAVAIRDAVPAQETARLEQLLPGLAGRVDMVPMPQVCISSSELRRRLSLGKTARYWLSDSVQRYASDHRLYANGTFTDAQEAALPVTPA
jgi:nicotinate-nucleotide adenylyltransferase